MQIVLKSPKLAQLSQTLWVEVPEKIFNFPGIVTRLTTVMGRSYFSLRMKYLANIKGMKYANGEERERRETKVKMKNSHKKQHFLEYEKRCLDMQNTTFLFHYFSDFFVHLLLRRMYFIRSTKW